ncbi:MAG: family 20 glycosylhydrolase [Kiritimatiellia bacterium]
MKMPVLLAAALGLLVSFADEMKLMSFNVCHCAGMDGKIDLARTAAAIRAEDPDFACLQELDWRTARSGGTDQPAELGRLAGLHATFAKAIFFQGGQYGVAILSREQPREVFTYPLPGAEPRVLLLCEFSDCVVGTTHLSVGDEAERTASVAVIRRAIAPFVGQKPVFLSGDWNSTPESAVLQELGTFLQVVSGTCGQTYHGRKVDGPDGQPLDRSQFCIDYVACDREAATAFKVLDARVVEDRTTSDHAPVVVTLATPSVTSAPPCVVPRPASMVTGDGVYRAKAGEVDATLFAARTTDAAIPPEGYRLTIGADGIAVAASGEAGFFYAGQTLRQLAFCSYGRLSFPHCTIKDAPRFGWRGVHLDESRHFFGKAAVKRTLDLMALHKLNVFHWHLTDDQGWRLPVAAYPLLTTVGAVRRCSTNQKNLADRFEDGEYGPFAYTREDIREVVAYARARQIRVIPEVDVPGHCEALLRAYPACGCFADAPEQAPADAVGNVVCLGDDRTLAMIHAVFDEVAGLFPDELVHIGGDEVNKANYRACPKCQTRMRQLGLKTENELQAWFCRELGQRLAARGKRVLGWDELVLDGRPPANMVVMSWRGTEGAAAAAKVGLEAVMCPHESCYFDYRQCIDDDPATYPWFTCRLPLAKAYAYDPFAGVAEESRKFILGGQCCNWTEFTCNETELQWKLWPRACATAEVFWTPAAGRDYADFRRRLATHRRRLLARRVNCAPF